MEAFAGAEEGCHGMFNRCGFSASAGPDAAASFLRGRRIEFHKSDEAYFAYVAVTGLKGDSLKIKLRNGRLTILKATLNNEPEAPGPSEAPEAQWDEVGSYEVPEDVVQDGIFAQVANGELFVSLPRVPQDPAVEIPIVDADSDAWVEVNEKKET